MRDKPPVSGAIAHFLSPAMQLTLADREIEGG